MDLRYSRNIPAISPEEQDTLKGKKVLVLGCGGLGGYIIENLLRMGVGAITAVDGDSFDESNLNRQLLATEKTLGTNKAIAAAQRANAVNSQV
ncbi:MAG: ThiF family adenylyltransferase, partial [Oscillospiraceae bacterium]|nr:ThiF family adenylyltransferase [Oscillospiraceae bacterium]